MLAVSSPEDRNEKNPLTAYMKADYFYFANESMFAVLLSNAKSEFHVAELFQNDPGWKAKYGMYGGTTYNVYENNGEEERYRKRNFTGRNSRASYAPVFV